MNSIAAPVLDRVKDGLVRGTIGLTVAGARRLPAFRERVLRSVSDALGRSYAHSYGSPEDRERLARYVWFGRSIKPFLVRLIQERPRAARKLVYLAYIWASDVRRRREVLGRGSVAPVTAVLEPTPRCNLRCPGCYANSTAEGDELPYEVWRDVIAELRDMGLTLVTFSGGEPFLREAKDKFITRMAAEFPNLGFLVYTNATMIDEEAARRLGEVANVYPAISVEGYERESDARRGAGYSSNASRVRERLARNEVMYGFSATVTRKNAELVSSDEFIDRRIAEGDMFGWYFLLQPIGRRPDVSLLVTAEQRARLRDQIYKWRCERKPIFLGDFWNDGPLAGGCIAAGHAYLHIYGNGDISPCAFAPVACGNIMDIRSGKSPYRSLGEFVNRHPFFVRFREKQAEITDRRAPCPLMDHPEKFRAVCSQGEWFPGNNMPEGYLDGEIAKALDANAEEWRQALARMPQVPDCARPEIEAIVSELAAHCRAGAERPRASA